MPSIILNFTYVANFPSVCSTYVPISSTHFIPSQLFLRKWGGVMASAIYQSTLLTSPYPLTHDFTYFNIHVDCCSHTFMPQHMLASHQTLDVLACQTFFSFDHLNKPRPNGRPLGNPNICKSTQLLHASFPVASSCCYRADPLVCRSSPESHMTLLSDVSTA